MRYPLLALLLAACAPMQNQNLYWEKPGASSQQFEMDKGQCQAQAFSIPNAPLVQAAVVFNSCLRGKGWVQVER